MTTKRRGHSKFGGSSMDRVIECPGSASLCAGLPEEETDYALEGSIAHRVAEKCFLVGVDPSFYVGKNVLLEDGRGAFITQEMASFVSVYTKAIRALVDEIDGTVHPEMSVHLDWLHDDFWGTVDTIVVPTYGDTLHVVDFKYGAGVPVDVQDNTQLKFYGLGALGKPKKTGEVWKYVKVGICQPRINFDVPIAWAEPISVEDLRAWGDTVLLPAAKRACGKNPPLIAGGHCRWCKAAAVCPQIHNAVAEVEQALKEDPVLTPAFCARMMELRPRIEQLMKKVYAVSLDILKQNGEVPGFKLVLGRSDRKWKEGAQDALGLILGESHLYAEPKLRSPAQLEALIVEQGGSKKDLQDWIEKTEGNLTLAPITDNRVPVTAMSPADIFETEKGK